MHEPDANMKNSIGDDLPNRDKQETLRAIRRIMDLLSRRDHSEKELKAKLHKFFSPENTAKAIEEAKNRKWLSEPEILSARAAESLGRKLKGQKYIQNHLKKRGLPPISISDELELEKAVTLVKNKWNNKTGISTEKFSIAEKQKIARFLLSRGFGMATIGKVINGKF